MAKSTEYIHNITQDSIDSVKCKLIIHGENSQRINKYIQYLCKKVLSLSSNRTDKYKNYEVGILARLDGTHENSPLYGTDEISNENEEYLETTITSKANSLVFVHNHPNNSSVSYNDIMELFNNEAIKIVIAVGNNGRVSYVAKTNNNGEVYIRIISKIGIKIGSLAKNERIKFIKQIYNDIIQNPDKYMIQIGGFE